MREYPTRKIAVLMQREPLQSRWASHSWHLHGVVPDVGGESRTLIDDGTTVQRLFPGLELFLYPDEAEGYYLNVSTDEPSVFVSVRLDDAEGEPYPFQATLSYNEAARWMDGGEQVERVPAWPELAAWVGQWVEDNYRPEPKERRKPRSFEGKGHLRERN